MRNIGAVTRRCLPDGFARGRINLLAIKRKGDCLAD
jgi:hypothetical protein